MTAQGDAHREWHRNAGVPVGGSCPWDCCDPYAAGEDFADWHRDNALRSQPYVNNIKAILGRFSLYTGAYDRLWKMLECHEIDVRTPGDGTMIDAERWADIEQKLNAHVDRYYRNRN